MGEAVGAVKALWRFPVKSMRGEKVDVSDLTEGGLVGDRAYALVDAETGKVLSGKSPRLGPSLLGCRAAFVEAPQVGDEQPPVRITFPDGTSVGSDAPDVEATLSGFVGRPVKLEHAAPEDFTIDHYHPDIDDLDPEGHRDTVTESKLGSAFFAAAGLPSAVPVGAFFDLFPVSVMTTSTLDRLNELRPESRFDERRFRMNVIVETREAGFLENGWPGRGLEIGDSGAPGCGHPRSAMRDDDVGAGRASEGHRGAPHPRPAEPHRRRRRDVPLRRGLRHCGVRGQDRRGWTRSP